MEAKKITWFKGLDQILSSALGDDLHAIKEEVKNGICELWQINQTSYLITRIEADQQGKPEELVFVAAAGRDMQSAIPYFKELAKPLGVKKMRVHSKRPGMAKYLEPFGFDDVETVYKASI